MSRRRDGLPHQSEAAAERQMLVRWSHSSDSGRAKGETGGYHKGPDWPMRRGWCSAPCPHTGPMIRGRSTWLKNICGVLLTPPGLLLYSCFSETCQCYFIYPSKKKITHMRQKPSILYVKSILLQNLIKCRQASNNIPLADIKWLHHHVIISMLGNSSNSSASSCLAYKNMTNEDELWHWKI